MGYHRLNSNQQRNSFDNFQEFKERLNSSSSSSYVTLQKTLNGKLKIKNIYIKMKGINYDDNVDCSEEEMFGMELYEQSTVSLPNQTTFRSSSPIIEQSYFYFFFILSNY